MQTYSTLLRTKIIHWNLTMSKPIYTSIVESFIHLHSWSHSFIWSLSTHTSTWTYLIIKVTLEELTVLGLYPPSSFSYPLILCYFRSLWMLSLYLYYFHTNLIAYIFACPVEHHIWVILNYFFLYSLIQKKLMYYVYYYVC